MRYISSAWVSTHSDRKSGVTLAEGDLISSVERCVRVCVCVCVCVCVRACVHPLSDS
jgi:hypothetical protein